MDDRRFDTLARTLARSTSRRTAVRALAGVAVGSLFGLRRRDAAAASAQGLPLDLDLDLLLCLGLFPLRACIALNLPHVAEAACEHGRCVIKACDPGWGDCDGNAANGCETPLGTPDDCSGCGDACTSEQVCDGSGTCVDDCDREPHHPGECQGNCGVLGERCCAGGCTDGSECDVDGNCVPACGGAGEPCCFGRICDQDGLVCGSCHDCDDNDHTLTCGSVCEPDCDGKTCGGDGCGGSCGTCDANQCLTCGAEQTCELTCTSDQVCDGSGTCVAICGETGDGCTTEDDCCGDSVCHGGFCCPADRACGFFSTNPEVCCAEGVRCSHGDVCEPCGGQDDICCWEVRADPTTGCDADLECTFGVICSACGGQDDPCCFDRSCDGGLFCNIDVVCVAVCGVLGDRCCDTGCTDGSECDADGNCVPACGGTGEACCYGFTCDQEELFCNEADFICTPR